MKVVKVGNWVSYTHIHTTNMHNVAYYDVLVPKVAKRMKGGLRFDMRVMFNVASWIQYVQ